MLFHALEDINKKLDGAHDARAFVEHYAFRPATHDSVADFGATRGAGLREPFQYLCRPDNRHMCGFAEPQHFFLDLRQSLEAHFDGKIATRHHHANGWRTQAGEQDPREAAGCGGILDLKHDTEVAGTERVQVFLE